MSRSPSTGLLEHPEDAIYYEWVLHDAAEAPFATFCFHYRAWAYLWDLNLVTDDDNSLLHHNSTLWEGCRRNQHKVKADERLKDGADTASIGLDLGHFNRDARGLGIASPQTAYTYHSQSDESFSETRFDNSPEPYDTYGPLATMLAPTVQEEDWCTGSYGLSEHDRRVMPSIRSYSGEYLCSRFRPLPTVDEVPRLE